MDWVSAYRPARLQDAGVEARIFRFRLPAPLTGKALADPGDDFGDAIDQRKRLHRFVHGASAVVDVHAEGDMGVLRLAGEGFQPEEDRRELIPGRDGPIESREI